MISFEHISHRYETAQIINDISPQMTIIQPPPIIELGSNQEIPILISIEDDFGFSNLQLCFRAKLWNR